MKIGRIERRDVIALRTLTQVIELDQETGQYFCELPKSWEIWYVRDSLPMRAKRIPRKQVYFVHLK